MPVFSNIESPRYPTKEYITVVVGHKNAGVSMDEVDIMCDGNNDFANIIDAINIVNAAGGGTVLIREGVYNIEYNREVNFAVLNSNIKIQGMGAGTQLITTEASDDKYWTISFGATLNSSAIMAKNIEICDLTVDEYRISDEAGGDPYSEYNPLFMLNAFDTFEIHDCFFMNMVRSVIGITIDKLADRRKNLRFYNNTVNYTALTNLFGQSIVNSAHRSGCISYIHTYDYPRGYPRLLDALVIEGNTVVGVGPFGPESVYLAEPGMDSDEQSKFVTNNIFYEVSKPGNTVLDAVVFTDNIFQTTNRISYGDSKDVGFIFNSINESIVSYNVFDVWLAYGGSLVSILDETEIEDPDDPRFLGEPLQRNSSLVGNILNSQQYNTNQTYFYRGSSLFDAHGIFISKNTMNFQIVVSDMSDGSIYTEKYNCGSLS